MSDKNNEIMEFDDSVDEIQESEMLPSEGEDNPLPDEESDISKKESAQQKKDFGESKQANQDGQNPLIKKALIGVGVLVVLGGSYVGYLMFASGANDLSLSSEPRHSPEVPAGLTLVEDGLSVQPKTEVSASPDVNSVLNSINKPQNSVPLENESFLVETKALEPERSEEVLLGQGIADQIEELAAVTKAIQSEISSRFNHLNNTLAQKDQGVNQQQGKLQELLINLQKDNQALLKESEAQKELISKLKAVTKEAYEKLVEYKKVNSFLKKKLKAKKRKALKKKKVVNKAKTISLSGDWKVSGANNQMVVLNHKSGATEVKKIGELIEGHKILKINVQKGLIQTSNGIILIP